MWTRLRRISKAIIAGLGAGAAALAGTAAGSCASGAISECGLDQLGQLTLSQIITAVVAVAVAFGATYQIRNVEPVNPPVN